MPLVKNPELALDQSVPGALKTTVPETPRPSVGDLPPPPLERAELEAKKAEAKKSQALPPSGKASHARSPLGVYLEQAHLSEQSFARAAGLALRTVQALARGVTVPTLVVAKEVERLTKGIVPMECWFGLPQVKETLREIRAAQPAGVQQWPDQSGVGTVPERPKPGAKHSITQASDAYDRQENPGPRPDGRDW